MKNILPLLFLLNASLFMTAQVPVTDLYLFQLTEQPTGEFHIHTPRHLSSFNRGGYTNQPFFVTDSELYVSVRKPGESQNDIYAIGIDSKSVRQVTSTPQSEFSPALLPGTGLFACVRQTHEGENRQNLFAYPLDQRENGEILLQGIDHVGYFCPLENDAIALFLVDGESRLAIGSMIDTRTEVLFSNIGRCLRRHPDGSLVYVHKYTDEYWYLKSIDLKTKKASIIDETLAGAEDFCMDRTGRIFMAQGSKLYVHPGVENGEWSEIADLSVYGITKITRLALNRNNQLALININE